MSDYVLIKIRSDGPTVLLYFNFEGSAFVIEWTCRCRIAIVYKTLKKIVAQTIPLT